MLEDCQREKNNTLHTDPIHLPRDPTIFPTETPGNENKDHLEDML